MFRNRLENMIDMRHELVRLARLINWQRFDEAFGPLYAEQGRPGLPTRLMAGLHLLKHARGLSDEQVCAAWLENAYFQFFCGETYFRLKLPLDRTSMSNWRVGTRAKVPCGFALARAHQLLKNAPSGRRTGNHFA
jgi:IS5 family transposase